MAGSSPGGKIAASSFRAKPRQRRSRGIAAVPTEGPRESRFPTNRLPWPLTHGVRHRRQQVSIGREHAVSTREGVYPTRTHSRRVRETQQGRASVSPCLAAVSRRFGYWGVQVTGYEDV